MKLPLDTIAVFDWLIAHSQKMSGNLERQIDECESDRRRDDLAFRFELEAAYRDWLTEHRELVLKNLPRPDHYFAEIQVIKRWEAKQIAI